MKILIALLVLASVVNARQVKHKNRTLGSSEDRTHVEIDAIADPAGKAACESANKDKWKGKKWKCEFTDDPSCSGKHGGPKKWKCVWDDADGEDGSDDDKGDDEKKGGHMTVIGNQGWKNHKSGKKPNTCVPDGKKTAAPKNQYGNKIGVACCDNESSNKGSRPNCVGKARGATYAEAEKHCKSKGKVLCSAKQIEKGAARGSGCAFDAYLQWTRDECTPSGGARGGGGEPGGNGKHMTVVGRVTAWRNHKSGKKPNTCVRDNQRTAPPKNRFGNKIGVACCRDANGFKGAHKGGDRPNCIGKKSGATYAEAVKHCKSKGMQLCSVKQIENGAAAGSGCMFDAYLQWTRDTC